MLGYCIVFCTILYNGADDVMMMCINSQHQRAKHQSREAPIRVCAEIRGGGANLHRLRSRSLSGPAVAQGFIKTQPMGGPGSREEGTSMLMSHPTRAPVAATIPTHAMPRRD